MKIKDIGFITVGFLLGAVGMCTFNNKQVSKDICNWEETNFYTIDTVVRTEYVYVNKKPKTEVVVKDTTIYTYKDSVKNIVVNDTIKILDGKIIDFKQELEIPVDSIILKPIVHMHLPRSLNIALGIGINNKIQPIPKIAVKFKQHQIGFSYNSITHEKSISYHRWLFKATKKRPKISTISDSR